LLGRQISFKPLANFQVGVIPTSMLVFLPKGRHIFNGLQP
jgi:hypothetical protein